jgi:hypothetical protein
VSVVSGLTTPSSCSSVYCVFVRLRFEIDTSGSRAGEVLCSGCSLCLELVFLESAVTDSRESSHRTVSRTD